MAALPHPVLEKVLAGKLSLPHRIEQRDLQCFLDRVAAPKDGLECRVEAVAFGDGDVHQVFELLAGGALAAAQEQRVAEHHHAVL